MLPVECPHCRHRYRVAAAPGESVRCPGCGKWSAAEPDPRPLPDPDQRRRWNEAARVLLWLAVAGWVSLAAAGLVGESRADALFAVAAAYVFARAVSEATTPRR